MEENKLVTPTQQVKDNNARGLKASLSSGVVPKTVPTRACFLPVFVFQLRYQLPLLFVGIEAETQVCWWARLVDEEQRKIRQSIHHPLPHTARSGAGPASPEGRGTILLAQAAELWTSPCWEGLRGTSRRGFTAAVARSQGGRPLKGWPGSPSSLSVWISADIIQGPVQPTVGDPASAGGLD